MFRNTEFLEKFWLTYHDTLPKVTTQLPIYNEKYVAERLIHAVVNLDYPKELHEIQVLDDSQDETKDIVAAVVKKYRDRGYTIHHICRENRTGFKAGALNEGLKRANGEFLAIFDADFLPDRDFLYKTIPFFYENKKIALVQARWGYINRNYSLLTRAQSLGMDGHFVIEQGARTWNGLYMNFNGTAGILRKEAIIDAGGWHYDTLTEDLDLSYRVQLRGWNTKFIFDVVTPSELPIDINAYKSQQHRWAKGSIQTSKKILPQIFKTNDCIIKKVQAFLHLNQHMIHPVIIILIVLSNPLVLFLRPLTNRTNISLSMEIFWGLTLLGTFAPSFLHIVAQKVNYKDWLKRCIFLPVLLCVGCGITVNNTKAVIEALFNRKSDFIRTPKYGVVDHGKIPPIQCYTLPVKLTFFCEMFLSIYCFTGFLQYVMNREIIFGYFLLMCAIGFFYVGTLSFLEKLRRMKWKNS